jgi:hypothetical protein
VIKIGTRGEGRGARSRGWAAGLLIGLCSSLAPRPSALSFDLPKEAVYPRIFTPNGDGINDAALFHVANPSLDTLEGKVYDGQGSFVANIGFNTGFTRGMWDGRDGNGNVVRAGVYIFEISNGGRSVTGTVVVAK